MSLSPHMFLCDVSASIPDEGVEQSVLPAIQAKRAALKAGIESVPVFVCGFAYGLKGIPMEITREIAEEPACWSNLAQNLTERAGGTDVEKALRELCASGFVSQQNIRCITVVSDLLMGPFVAPDCLGQQDGPIEVDFVGLPGILESDLQAFADKMSPWAQVYRADLAELEALIEAGDPAPVTPSGPRPGRSRR